MIEEIEAKFPCCICGAEIVPSVDNRCGECLRFACRACLKKHYHKSSDELETVTHALCYDCYHSIYEKPWAE